MMIFKRNKKIQPTQMDDKQNPYRDLIGPLRSSLTDLSVMYLRNLDDLSVRVKLNQIYRQIERVKDELSNSNGKKIDFSSLIDELEQASYDTWRLQIRHIVKNDSHRLYLVKMQLERCIKRMKAL